MVSTVPRIAGPALEHPIVEMSNGAVRGRTSGGVTAFKGIPYAAPPFGEHRFAPPRPPSPWDEVRDALEYGPTAPKPAVSPPYDVLLPDLVIAGEHCLNLNVWTPDLDASGLPVMVWIHGGGFANGTGALAAFDGARFARDGVVLVTINYRLGIDGFLILDGAVGNRGLLDQIAALEWVRGNIARFGGDPARVTVAGQSAGAMSIAALLASPRAAGLIGQAIVQSGAGHHAMTLATAERVASYVADHLGVAACRESLGGIPLERLIDAQAAVSSDAQLTPDKRKWGEVAMDLLPFEPVVDGEVLPGRPIDRMPSSVRHGVRVLAGTNADEQRLFLVPNGISDAATHDLVAIVAWNYGLDVASALRTYGAGRLESTPGEIMAAIIGDWQFRIPAIRLCEAVQSSGGTAYQYEFAWPSPEFGGRLGACHNLELGFVFDNLGADCGAPLEGDAPPQSLADEMHRAWVNFAKTGDPGWPAYDSNRRPVMRFAPHSDVVDDPRGEQRALWAGVR